LQCQSKEKQSKTKQISVQIRFKSRKKKRKEKKIQITPMRTRHISFHQTRSTNEGEKADQVTIITKAKIGLDDICGEYVRRPQQHQQPRQQNKQNNTEQNKTEQNKKNNNLNKQQQHFNIGPTDCSHKLTKKSLKKKEKHRVVQAEVTN
jgi:hypothetical protein